MVGIEVLRPAIIGKRFHKRLDTKVVAEPIGQPPAQHRTARPAHGDHQMEKAFGHRDITNVHTPHLVDPFDREAPRRYR